MTDKPEIATTMSPERDDVQRLHEQWFWFIALGVGMIMAGIFAMASSLVATLAVVTLFGVILAVAGITQIVTSLWSPRWGGITLHLLLGILYLVVGVLIVDNPVQTAVALTLLMAAFFVVVGLFRIVVSLQTQFRNWGWSLLAGFISLLLGIFTWAHWPASGIWVIGLFVGLELFFNGLSWLMFAVTARRTLANF